MRKRYTNQFKAQVVQELLKEGKTLNQLAAEHGVHPNQLKRWEATALEGLPRLMQLVNHVETLPGHLVRYWRWLKE